MLYIKKGKLLLDKNVTVNIFFRQNLLNFDQPFLGLCVSCNNKLDPIVLAAFSFIGYNTNNFIKIKKYFIYEHVFNWRSSVSPNNRKPFVLSYELNVSLVNSIFRFLLKVLFSDLNYLINGA